MCCIDPALDWMFQVPAISTAWGPFWPQKVWPSVAWQEFRFEGTRTTSWSTKGWCAWSKSPRASQPFLRAWERTSRCETTARQGDLSKVLGGLSLVRILWVHPLKSHIYASTWDIVKAGRHQAEAREIAAPRKLALGGPSFGLHSKPVATVCLKEASKGCLVFGRGTV